MKKTVSQLNAIRYITASLFVISANSSYALIDDNLLTQSKTTTPWQQCDTDAVGIDVTNLNVSGCAYRQTEATAGITYKMTCGVSAFKYSSITLAFLDAADVTLASETTEINGHESGAYSVTLQAPAGTASAAVGIYGEPGSGFQDCVLVDATPTPEPTEGSISGISWFDANEDSLLESAERRISGTNVALQSNGNTIDLTTTKADGSYYFGNLDVDQCYTIEFKSADATLQLGTVGGDNDASANGVSADICLTDAVADVANIDVAYVAIPPVVPPADFVACGVTWLDLNENGTYDSGDSNLANVPVSLIDISTGSVVANEESDNKGDFAFTEIAQGEYQLQFTKPDGHTFTTRSASLVEGGSIVTPEGQSSVFHLPSDGNTDSDAVCTVRYLNAGFVRSPVALDPTVAKNDSASSEYGVDFSIDILANDAPCNATALEVTLLGHNVPGEVSFDGQSQQLQVSNTTDAGTFKLEYGLRGACGSYDTAEVEITLTKPVPPIAAAAPEAPHCRVETGGSTTIGGVDVFHPEENGFAPQYNLYDRDQALIITLSSDDYTHKFYQGATTNKWAVDFVGNWEIEWNGTRFGYDQVSIYYMSAVDNGLESALTECIRHYVSPIALDLNNDGNISQIAGDFNVDLSGNGITEHLVAWFAPTDGILINKQASGKIDGNALFGNLEGVYADGYEKLALLDKNDDAQLTGDELSTLAVWRDTNSNTIIDDGEVSSLASHAINSLSVTHYKFKARAGKTDGKTLLMEDVWLPVAPFTLSAK